MRSAAVHFKVGVYASNAVECSHGHVTKGSFNSYTTVCCPKIKDFVLKSPDPRRTDQEVRFKGVLQELATGYFLHAKNG